MKQLLIFIFIIPSYFGHTQNNCNIEFASNLLTEEGKFSVEVVQKPKITRLVFKNPTKDTLYIFSSYFEERFYKSKYLNRVNRKNKELKLSFLPLLPYLSTSKSDRILPGSNALVNRGQLSYKFILIPPGTTIFKDLNINSDVTVSYSKDINLSGHNMYDRIKFKDRKLCSSLDTYKKVMEFAIYKNINGLCNNHFFSMYPEEYNGIAKEFEIFSLEY